MEELIIGCKKFLIKEYSVEEFSRFLSKVAVPIEIIKIVTEIENKIEYIRFMVSESQRYNECVKAVNQLLEEIES